jgi:hypothetical protein
MRTAAAAVKFNDARDITRSGSLLFLKNSLISRNNSLFGEKNSLFG